VDSVKRIKEMLQLRARTKVHKILTVTSVMSLGALERDLKILFKDKADRLYIEMDHYIGKLCVYI
jgi:hypothetical protein